MNIKQDLVEQSQKLHEYDDHISTVKRNWLGLDDWISAIAAFAMDRERKSN